MADFVLRWHGKDALGAIRSKLKDGVREATVALRNNTRQLITRPYPPASIGGEPPARRTGDLWRSVTAHSPNGLEGIVSAGGGGVGYARDLEFGRPGLDQRPYMRPSFDELVPIIKDFFK